MKPLIIANWKCNPKNQAEAKELFNLIKRGVRKIKGGKVVICPPFVYLPILKNSNFPLGAQNCFWKELGPFTGEVSVKMLKDFGCQYVILGHSERRKYFGETDEMINQKLKTALKAKLKPIFCIGESWEERKRDKAQQVLKSQLEKGLKSIKKRGIKNLILAYEPVWAIGTGRPCSPVEAQTMSLFLRKIIAKLYSLAIAKNTPILYGGSVNSKNARDYVVEARMNGLLVGGASLDAKEFVKIVKSISIK